MAHRPSPADGTTLPAGRYAIEVALGDARDYLSTAAGRPWIGAALQSASVSVLVALAATARERPKAFRLAGDIALRGNRQAEAVQAFQRARSADPTEHLSVIASRRAGNARRRPRSCGKGV